MKTPALLIVILVAGCAGSASNVGEQSQDVTLAPAIGVRSDGSIDPAIVDCYQRSGGAQALGAPRDLGAGAYLRRWADGLAQDVGGGALGDAVLLHRDGDSGAYLVSGDSYRTFVQGGSGRTFGSISWLGYPLGDAQLAADGTGQQLFENGYISTNADGSTMALAGSPAQAWSALVPQGDFDATYFVTSSTCVVTDCLWNQDQLGCTDSPVASGLTGITPDGTWPTPVVSSRGGALTIAAWAGGYESPVSDGVFAIADNSSSAGYVGTLQGPYLRFTATSQQTVQDPLHGFYVAQRIGCHVVATTDPGRMQESALDYPALAACAKSNGGVDRLGTAIWGEGAPVYALFVYGGTTARAQEFAGGPLGPSTCVADTGSQLGHLVAGPARAQWLATGPQQLGAPYDEGQPFPGGTLQKFDAGYILTRSDSSTEVLGTSTNTWPADVNLGFGLDANHYVNFPITACVMANGGPAAFGAPRDLGGGAPVHFLRSGYYEQDFSGGTLGNASCYMFETDDIAYAVSGPFWSDWSVGGLGKPRGDQVNTATGAWQQFSIGWVVWDRASNGLSLSSTQP